MFKKVWEGRKRRKNEKKNTMRRPGIEPGTIAWKATMLTTTPPTLICTLLKFNIYEEQRRRRTISKQERMI